MEAEAQKLAMKLLSEWQGNSQVMNEGARTDYEKFDQLRTTAIETRLRPLLDDFINDQLDLEDFKKKNDSANRTNPYWGFKGINGQMFFNMLFNTARDKDKLSSILKGVLKSPLDIVSAKEKINQLIDFVRGETSAVDRRSLPRIKSVLYFLSYFWQIQLPEKYPIFYNSLEQTLIDLGFLSSTSDLPVYYEKLFNLNNELVVLYRHKIGRANPWLVEYVFWKYYVDHQGLVENPPSQTWRATHETQEQSLNFIPQILANYNNLALNEVNPVEFERRTGDLFKVLGFDVTMMGQGTGRTVDVIAIAYASKPPYTLLIDCKARSRKDFKLSAGEERSDIEHIRNFYSDNLRYENFETHYLIVSSGFGNIDEVAIGRIKADTNLDISFVTANTLLFLVNQKLQNWLIDLKGRVREIFRIVGIVTEDKIQEIIGR